jgi:hypothetical protein
MVPIYFDIQKAIDARIFMHYHYAPSDIGLEGLQFAPALLLTEVLSLPKA